MGHGVVAAERGNAGYTVAFSSMASYPFLRASLMCTRDTFFCSEA